MGGARKFDVHICILMTKKITHVDWTFTLTLTSLILSAVSSHKSVLDSSTFLSDFILVWQRSAGTSSDICQYQP